MTEFLPLSILSFLFGVTQKLSDGHHEHVLNFFPDETGGISRIGMVCGANPAWCK